MKKENCKVAFYHIDDDFFPQKNFPEDAYILYPNYFGICDKNVEILAEKYANLIVDNAHSFYSEPKGLACFNSARKFLPVYNGSFLWIKKNHILLQTENIVLDAPRNELEFIKNENDFMYSDIKLLNFKTEQQIRNCDTRAERKEIFKKYHQIFGEKNLLSIDIDFVYSPFCYPYLAKKDSEADEVANILKKSGVDIYRYWNELPADYPEYKFYKRLVPIPINKFML